MLLRRRYDSTDTAHCQPDHLEGKLTRLRLRPTRCIPDRVSVSMKVRVRCCSAKEGHLRVPSLASLSSLCRLFPVRSPPNLVFARPSQRSLSTAGLRGHPAVGLVRARLCACARLVDSSSPHPIPARCSPG